MKILLVALYTALILGANTAFADIAALRTGDMTKLTVHDRPQPVTDAPFLAGDSGGKGRLSDYRGKIVLLNFWATWCGPCRKEMPMLAALQTEFSGEGFEVVTLATGRNSPQGIKRFFDKAGIDNLPHFRDPKQVIAKAMNIDGLPITVILDRKGQEIARLRGDADWASDSARAIISSLLAEK